MRAGYGQHEELKIWVVPRFVQSTWRKNDEKLMREGFGSQRQFYRGDSLAIKFYSVVKILSR